MIIPAITIPDSAVADTIAGLEARWKADAEKLATAAGFVYDDMGDRAKIRIMTIAIYRVSVRNLRRAEAERVAALSVADVEVT